MSFSPQGEGTFNSQRKKLHDDIITAYLQKYPSQENPYIHFILGSIGSGKTSLKDSVIGQKELKSVLYINFDELKQQLPEYKILQKLNPKKAAHFVQSESAKLAGTLFQKAVQKKKNIIYEKNLRLGKNNKLHVKEEIKKVLKKGYKLSVHVVFLDSYQEAWKRVQLRYDKIKRYVSQKEVKDTFQNLFVNLDTLLNQNYKEEYLVKFWYNGRWEIDRPKKAYIVGVLAFHKKLDFNQPLKDLDFATTLEGMSWQNSYYSGFWLKRRQALPKIALKKLDSTEIFKKNY